MGVRALRLEPSIMMAVVPGVHLAVASVRDRSHPGNASVVNIQSPGCIGISGGVGLHEDGVAVGKANRPRVIESTNALQSPKRVIEGSILLHQDDYVFSVEISGSLLRLDSKCSLN